MENGDLPWLSLVYQRVDIFAEGYTEKHVCVCVNDNLALKPTVDRQPTFHSLHRMALYIQILTHEICTFFLIRTFLYFGNSWVILGVYPRVHSLKSIKTLSFYLHL